jgi:NAD(P) transhydrogenase subunit alpha
MIVGIPKDRRPGERRLAATPETVAKYIAHGCDVLVARGCGDGAGIEDAAWEKAGARIVDAEMVWSDSDLVLKASKPTWEEAEALKRGASLLAWFDSDEKDPLVQVMVEHGSTLLAVDAVPRTTKAQKMDVRSSMANLAGYRAIIESAARFRRTIGAQVTAAGSTPPAKVLVIGAGVAGLAAVATARGLGAIVRAFDSREAAREQVASLGAEFLTVSIQESGDGSGGYGKEMSKEFLDAEYALFRQQAAEVDVVVTTALIPGRPAPKLWHDDMVELMAPGSIVVDLASQRGGNCTKTVPGSTVVHKGVTILGEIDLTQAVADHATKLLARNVFNLVDDLGITQGRDLDLTDIIARGVTVVEKGVVKWPAPPPNPSPQPQAAPAATAKAGAPAAAPVVAKAAPESKPAEAVVPEAHKELRPPPPTGASVLTTGASLVVMLGLAALGWFAPADFLQHLTVFVLACFVGWLVVWNVSPALHTPLMSVTNAISGIIVVGGILQVGSDGGPASVLGLLALLFAAINIFGGFGVTRRMLAMFHQGGAR